MSHTFNVQSAEAEITHRLSDVTHQAVPVLCGGVDLEVGASRISVCSRLISFRCSLCT
jgi:hypothetical protein